MRCMTCLAPSARSTLTIGITLRDGRDYDLQRPMTRAESEMIPREITCLNGASFWNVFCQFCKSLSIGDAAACDNHQNGQATNA